MDPSRFDAVSKLLAKRRVSRRRALAKGAAGVAAGVLAGRGVADASAQNATPNASTDQSERHTSTLFVQSFQSGTITPKSGEDGTFTLTLSQGVGRTIYFTDRPERNVGTVSTPAFLKGLCFSPVDPPNAALVLETSSHDEVIAVLELYNPIYDAVTNTATYDVQPLEQWEHTLTIGIAERPNDLADIQPTFGAANLFIDDCGSGDVECSIEPSDDVVAKIDPGPFCFSPIEPPGCLPCVNGNLSTAEQHIEYWTNRCNLVFEACKGECIGTVRLG
jgi:hypothetical protein